MSKVTFLPLWSEEIWEPYDEATETETFMQLGHKLIQIWKLELRRKFKKKFLYII